MPSTYSSSLRLELQATGENANTWGTKTNNNLELIEQAIAGYVKITLTSASATYPLVIADASASDGRNAYIEFVGTVASAISITVPDVEKGYWVKNSATGSPLTFRTSSGTGVVLPTNQWVNLVSDGASITSTFPTSITGYALLSATQTFTGANTFTSLVNIQSNLSVTGNAFVSGVTTLASAVDIKGATSLASTLVVGGAATFNSNVSVSGVMVVGAGAVGAPSYSTTGDTNTGLYFPAADTIAVATSGTERMRITSGGLVGIGTSSPNSNAVLTNNGNIAIAAPTRNQATSNQVGVWTSDDPADNGRAAITIATVAGGSSSNSYISFTTNNYGVDRAERMRIDSAGNVGIGTSSPGAKLEVAGTLTATGNTINFGGNDAINTIINVGGVPTGNKFSLTDYIGDTTYTDFGLRVGRVSDGANGTSLLQHRGTGSMILDVFDAGSLVAKTSSLERMRIDSSGNVGIGTSLPTFKFVAANSSTDGAWLYSSGAVSILGLGGYSGAASGAASIQYDRSSGDTTFNGGTRDSQSERMRINSSGNVGIGTASPLTKLHMLTPSATAVALRAGNSVSYAEFQVDASGNSQLIAPGGVQIFNTNGSERMRIDSAGNVGIGTTGPVGRLDVRGSNSAAFAFFAGTTKGVRFNIDSNVANLEGVDNTGFLSYQPLGLGGSTLLFATNGVERARIDSSGNVGIGTSSPDQYGRITSTPGATQVAFQSGVAGTAGYPAFGFVGQVTANGGRGAGMYLPADNTICISTLGAERLRIDGSGNVGIGTSSPASRLHVKGAWTTNEGQFQIDADSGQQFSGMTFQNNGTYKFIMYNDNTNSWTFLSTASGSNQSLLFGTNETERMRIDSAGNVRVGTAALATTATDGFLYVPTCAGTPTGTPTAITGLAPIVINTTNNKLYFYSGGAWRDAGP